MTFRWMFALVAACSAPAKTPETAQPPTSPGAGDATCPLEVPGTSVTVEDAPGGAALVFVTTGAVDQVRVRANKLADAHNQHASDAGSLAAMLPRDASAKASDVDGGSRVVLTAATPDGAGAVQSELRMHASHLSAGTCKMAM
jgi:hypothetical protein